MTVEEKIRKFILDNYLYTDDQSKLKDDESFLEKGIIDSTGVLEVISFLETDFGVTVTDEEMIPENLDSVRNLAAYINAKRANTGP